MNLNDVGCFQVCLCLQLAVYCRPSIEDSPECICRLCNKSRVDKDLCVCIQTHEVQVELSECQRFSFYAESCAKIPGVFGNPAISELLESAKPALSGRVLGSSYNSSPHSPGQWSFDESLLMKCMQCIARHPNGSADRAVQVAQRPTVFKLIHKRRCPTAVHRVDSDNDIH